MKKQFKSAALLAVLALAATGCQKENEVLPVAGTEQTTETLYVVYSINGEVFLVTLSESEWDAFVERMLALARQGYEVSFFKNRSPLASQCKEKVTFVTTDEKEAHAWASAMADEGYTVTITYDDESEQYTCIAIK